MSKAALWYASHGIPIFPVYEVRDGHCACGKTECDSPGKHPRSEHGFKDATTDAARVTAWWQKWPDANIGMPTGAVSGFLVLDADQRSGGLESLDRLRYDHGGWPDTAEQKTGGDGRHIVFRYRGGPAPKTLAPGIDLKWDGGYIILAPSIHISGKRYEWDGIKGAKALLKAASPPAWLVAAIDAASRTARPNRAAAVTVKLKTGGRNNGLTSLAGAMRRRGMSQQAIEAALLVDNKLQCDPPLSEKEVKQIVASVSRYAPGDDPANGQGDEPSGDTTEAKVKSDVGLVKEISDSILVGRHFARDAAGRVYVYNAGAYHPRGEFLIKQSVKHWLEENGKSKRWRKQLGEEALEYIRLDTPELLIGQEPPCDVLNLKNGLLDLKTLELRPHSPHFLYPIQIPVNYDPTATCPAIGRFISEVFPDDVQDLAWQILGDGLTPDRSIQKAILLTGEGGNGKGVFLALYINFLGRRNVSNLGLHRLEADRFAIARLYGKLANVCADLPSTHLAGTSVFKSITGNDSITGEFKFRDSFEFDPFCRLLFSANHPPQSRDASKAFYDRWLVVPFNRNFRDTKVEIPRGILDAQLSTPTELSGALNKALDSLKRVRAAGRFLESETTHAALAQFREVTDPLAVWLDRETVLHPAASVTQGELLTAYNLASECAGRPPMTKQAFGRAIKKLRADVQEAQRTVMFKTQWIYLGIGLKTRAAQTAPLDSRDSLDSHILVLPHNNPPVEQAYVQTVLPGLTEADKAEQDNGNRVNRVNQVNPGGNGRCFSCCGTRFWRKHSGELICERCHPAPGADAVAEWIEVHE
jgi:putative DNA primase/helicase